MNNAVSLEGLVKRYGKHRGIEGLDLKVKEGEWFGYIGPNGAGKSTTIRTMLGLIKATEGKSTVLGMDSWKEREKIMEKVGYLPSEAIFFTSSRISSLGLSVFAWLAIEGLPLPALGALIGKAPVN